MAKILSKCFSVTLLFIFFTAQSSVSATSTVVWDQSPDAIGGTLTSGSWSNRDSQHFADPVTFSSQTMITGMDIYMHTAFGNVGQQGTFHMRTGSHLGPLFEITVTVSETDNEGTLMFPDMHRVHVDFDNPIMMSANEIYWVGMFGNLFWTQVGMLNGSGPLLDNQTAVYMFDEFSSFSTNVGDTAFRLWGTPVPVPAAVWLFGSGLIGLFGLSRKSKETE